MADAKELAEYVVNVRALLLADPARWGMVVERQVIAGLLRHLHGPRAALEPHLWMLFVLCLDGPAAAVPLVDHAAWERLRQAAARGSSSEGDQPAAYPRAALAVAQALTDLRETGVYPRPLLGA